MNFGGIGAFEKHRVGDYGGPIYESETSHKVIGRRKPTRRCMTPEEMEAAGMVVSLEMVTVTVEGHTKKHEMLSWAIPLTEKQKIALAQWSHNAPESP
jgi:hypothetical protein